MAKQAAIVHMAAAQLAADNSAKPEARDQALALLMKEASVVSGQNFAFDAPEPVKFERLKPSDEPKEKNGTSIVEKVETAPPLPGKISDYTPKKVDPPKPPNLPNASPTPTPPPVTGLAKKLVSLLHFALCIKWVFSLSVCFLAFVITASSCTALKVPLPHNTKTA